MPQEFQHSFYDMNERGETVIYDVERLWKLAEVLPVEPVLLSAVEGELDYPYQWFKNKKPSPREVAKHARRIYEADLSYPVLLKANGTVMDGVHRIARCWIEGRMWIDAVRFPADLAPDVVLSADSLSETGPPDDKEQKTERFHE